MHMGGDLATAEAFAAEFSGTLVMPQRSNAAWGGRISEIASAVTVPAMRHANFIYVLVPLSLIVVGALVIKQISLREKAQPVRHGPMRPPNFGQHARQMVCHLRNRDIRRRSQGRGTRPVD